jgi:hypothetical protein
MIVIEPQGFQECDMREALFEQEKQLRARAKAASDDWTRAAELANDALKFQRARHRHSVGCELCLRLEPRKGLPHE